MKINKNRTFGLVKTLMDAHTMGIHSAASLLRECGFNVVLSTKNIENAIENLYSNSAQLIITDWIKKYHISYLGFSYRLDPDNGIELFERFISFLIKNHYYGSTNSLIQAVFFAGLKPACEVVEKRFEGRIKTFCGGESAEETLLTMGVSFNDIPTSIKMGCQYDKKLAEFGKSIIQSGAYEDMKPPERNMYPQYGTMKDTLELRLDNNFKGGYQPIIRAHSGPYSDAMSRIACLKEYQDWCVKLAEAGYLDVLSIGSSQLSQSNFGENWDGMLNGGGVPVNSEFEFENIWQSARPMLVRTYSGTKNIKKLAEIYERTINISWHALSLWWFNEIDGRGPNTLYDNLKEHIDTIRWIATTGKPLETNVPHHFAFRGADDVTYIISGFLAAKTAKENGIKTFVLQNMLNTPRSTWGIQDLAKGRTLIKLVKELEDNNFRVVLQTRAGLDYFKPDLETAKEQLASVTALMDDLDPYNKMSPEIIHVVSYSEALFLATPDIINDSIKITKTALNEYRNLKEQGLTSDVMTEEITRRQYDLEIESRKIIQAMENSIPNLYSPKGLYLAFVAGWLPTPDLWSNSDEYACAKKWETKLNQGGVVLCDHDVIVTADHRINRCIGNISEANYIFKHKYYDNLLLE